MIAYNYRSLLRWTLLLSLSIYLDACGGGSSAATSSSPAPVPGSIAGTISMSDMMIPASAKTAVVHRHNQTISAIQQDPQEFVVGEVFVTWIAGRPTADFLKRYQDVQLRDAGEIYPGGPHRLRSSVYGLTNDASRSATQLLMQRLRQDNEIRSAEFNGIRYAQKLPNDPAFAAGLQWDMQLMDMPAAWDITTGNSNIIVAVLDTGIRPHPDLDANVLNTGYNFVDNNNDPTEPLTPTAEFHGTHVAGTIAAIGNNGMGIAGTAWGVKLMPVRVLGPLYSTDDAVINGMLYAAGLPNNSGKLPPQKANVINLSLGSQSSCSQAYQQAINQVTAAGVVIVASAGNNSSSSIPETPASCQGVISVAAVDSMTSLTSYSDYQPYVTVAAPGGEELEGVTAAVMSTFPIQQQGQIAYRYMQGTSMAAPHVAGVVALMLSVNPSLTPTQVQQILTNSTAPLKFQNTISGIVQLPATSQLGMVLGGVAVAKAAGISNPTNLPASPWVISTLKNGLSPLSSLNQGTAIVTNVGGNSLNIGTISCLTGGGSWHTCNVGQSWLTINPGNCLNAVLSSASSCSLNIYIDPTSLANNQQYYGEISLSTNIGNVAVPVFFTLGQLTPPSSLGPLQVQLWSLNQQTGSLQSKISSASVAQVQATSSSTFSFSSVPAGPYFVVAGIDTNGDGVFGDAPGETTQQKSAKTWVQSGTSATVGLQINVVPDNEIVWGF